MGRSRHYGLNKSPGLGTRFVPVRGLVHDSVDPVGQYYYELGERIRNSRVHSDPADPVEDEGQMRAFFFTFDPRPDLSHGHTVHRARLSPRIHNDASRAQRKWRGIGEGSDQSSYHLAQGFDNGSLKVLSPDRDSKHLAKDCSRKWHALSSLTIESVPAGRNTQHSHVKIKQAALQAEHRVA